MDQPGSLFALKVLQKTDIQNFDMVRMNDGHAALDIVYEIDEMQHFSDDTDAERASLSELPWSPWANGVVGVFHDPLNLYLMLECIPAGVLHDIIYRRGPLDATMARFYYANIVCALEFLHANGIVHRDLKPANILVKPDGYISLVDFGLAKPETDSHTWAMVGTPIYMAPELTMSQAGVGCGIDWFSSGVILYEMVTKRVASIPFFGKEEEHIYWRISNKKYKWPRELRVGKSLKSMVAGLLTHEAVNRLGVAKPVTKHPWLSGIDWKKMNGQSYIAPWIPGELHLSRTWQDKRLGAQESVPDLEIVAPPEFLRNDRRLPRKRAAQDGTSNQE
ncbi:kinase-like domain-containing protein [Boletus reticuloceps]|uniref:cAMP-dependent protein kinase n=1 Tax=Boletus reticuloceps TaxID=495285 RepID=A0A8I2YQ00_9AGAM|nr:kinase-like domain-containing protein [Boletus reticuloceps]